MEAAQADESTSATSRTTTTEDDRARLSYAWRVLSVVSIASFMGALNQSTLNVALPLLVRQFDASPLAANWLLLSYQLANTTLMVLFGRLADVMGRRRMFMTGVALFTVTSLALGFSPNVGVMIGLRVLQAGAGALLMTNAAALVSAAFPRYALGRGLGVYTTSFSVAQLLGPSIGGLLATELGWRWTFWFSVPFGLICLVWGAVTLRKVPGTGERVGTDVFGNLTILLGLGSLLLALSEVGNLGWSSPLVFGGLVVFAIAIPLFLIVERRVRNPVVDLSLFRNPSVGWGTLAQFLGAMSRFAVVLLLGLYFQSVLGDSPSEAGLKILPLSIAAIVMSPAAGWIMRWMQPRTLAVVAVICSMAALIVLLFAMSPTGNYGWIVLGALLMGVGTGGFVPANNTAMLSDVPSNRLGIANAARMMAGSTGVVVSTAVSLTIITGGLPVALRQDVLAGTISQVSGDAVDQLVTGFRWALALMLLMSVLCLLASMINRRVNDREESERDG